jgi:hypothetical protein
VRLDQEREQTWCIKGKGIEKRKEKIWSEKEGDVDMCMVNALHYPVTIQIVFHYPVTDSDTLLCQAVAETNILHIIIVW